jgi:tetratricopeptide (TPR) repeat protein
MGSSSQIKQAQEALTRGETANAKKLFSQVLTQGTENAAEAAFQLSQLAYGRVDYQTAYRYLEQAVDLQPNNPNYLYAAGLIAYAMGQYSEAEPLYQRSLAIREGRSCSWLPSIKLFVILHPGVMSGVLHLKIFASAMALQRESAWVSGSPALFISHLAMSSCMAALIVTWLNDAGLFAPVISNRERPSRRSL